jgi:NADH-quinone oxidoreductase subunit A
LTPPAGVPYFGAAVFVNVFTSDWTHDMLESYVPIVILLGVSVANAVGMVALSHVVSPFRPTPVKQTPYESGMTPLGDTRERFSVKFYMVAILFIVFDLETIFLLAWGVVMRALGWEGFVAAMIFIVVLTVGMIYEWKKGALEWE